MGVIAPNARLFLLTPSLMREQSIAFCLAPSLLALSPPFPYLYCSALITICYHVVALIHLSSLFCSYLSNLASHLSLPLALYRSRDDLSRAKTIFIAVPATVHVSIRVCLHGTRLNKPTFDQIKHPVHQESVKELSNSTFHAYTAISCNLSPSSTVSDKVPLEPCLRSALCITRALLKTIYALGSTRNTASVWPNDHWFSPWCITRAISCSVSMIKLTTMLGFIICHPAQTARHSRHPLLPFCSLS